jgi:hypothetical protein
VLLLLLLLLLLLQVGAYRAVYGCEFMASLPEVLLERLRCVACARATRQQSCWRCSAPVSRLVGAALLLFHASLLQLGQP